jgi:hypothetical protein
MAGLAPDKDIYELYHHFKKMFEMGMRITEYCRTFGLNYKRISNSYCRTVYQRRSHPKEADRLIELYKLFKSTGANRKQFAEEHGVSPERLTAIGTHLNYIKTLKLILKEKGEKYDPNWFMIGLDNHPKKTREPEPFFREVAHKEPQQLQIHHPEPEVLSPRNDIELQISKGVRVLISPELDSMKIIKIIELLKDL